MHATRFASRVAFIAIAVCHAIGAADPMPSPAMAPDVVQEPLSEAVAVSAGVGVTAAGLALALLSEDADARTVGVGMWAVGPSLGHLYAGRLQRGMAGTALRLLAGATLAYGISLEEACDAEDRAAAFEGEGDGCDAYVYGPVVMIGFAMTAATTAYDLFATPESIRQANVARRRDLAPAAAPLPGGGVAFGLTGRF